MRVFFKNGTKHFDPIQQPIAQREEVWSTHNQCLANGLMYKANLQ